METFVAKDKYIKMNIGMNYMEPSVAMGARGA